MTTLFDMTLHDQTLSGLDDSITVTDIRESLQMKGNRRERIIVEVRLCIHEENPIRRREVMSRIIAWAGIGGYLTTTDRPGQRLAAVCTELPALSAQNWTAEMMLRFGSTHTPWWESSAPVMVSGNAVLTADVPGDAPMTVAEALLINTGTVVVNELRLQCALTQMTFRNLALQPGSIFCLMYSDGNLQVLVDGNSVLHCRTPESSDELTLPCGQTSTVYATTDGQPLEAAFTIRGRFA